MGDRKCLRSRFCDCVCVRWLCWDHWRMWCKPLIILIICLMVLFAMLPLLIYELYWKHANEWFTAWFVSGILVLFTFLIFLLGLMQHLFNYTQPQLQKHIIRFDLWNTLYSPVFFRIIIIMSCRIMCTRKISDFVDYLGHPYLWSLPTIIG